MRGIGPYHSGRESNVIDMADTHDLTVSLLDDDPSVVKATSRLLSSAGWKVASFTDPIEFLSYAQASHPQVVVLDILMPEMDGLEVQKRLQSFSPGSQVIVLTSKDDPAVRTKAMRAGATAFFVKPVADDQFLAEVKSAFAKQSSKQSNGIAA